jgi:sugar phosphate isomerase/epimerase
MLTRRSFAKIALAAPAAVALAQTAFAQKKINSVVGGVRLGAQSYSFRGLAFDDLVKAYIETGLGECELWQGNIEPRGLNREQLREWRLKTPLDEFRGFKKKFNDAGVEVYAYNYSFKDDFTDEEIDRGFEMAKALGVGMITASSTVTSAKRVVPFAEKHNMVVAYHGHSDIKNPNEFAKPEAFAAALAMSKKFAVNLDIGHFVAANYDPVEYLKANHASVPVIHLKDRKKNEGANTEWGQGETPIKEVLQLLKREKWPIRAMVEYEYRGSGTAVQEVKKCVEYCKAALA